MKFLTTLGEEGNECKLLHHEISCSIYKKNRLIQSFKTAFKIQLMTCVIPSLITQAKKLRKQPLRTLKKILIKFIRALLFNAFVTATPSFLACQFLPYGGIFKCD
jgi:hypothetical protein